MKVGNGVNVQKKKASPSERGQTVCACSAITRAFYDPPFVTTSSPLMDELLKKFHLSP
jgi:hypothetical protein